MIVNIFKQKVDLSALIQQHISVTPYFLREIRKGVMTIKFQFIAKEEEYVIRFYPKERSLIANKEYRILSNLRHNQCLVPNVEYTFCDKAISFIIYKKLSGITLSELEGPLESSLLSEISINLKCITELKHDFYGDIMTDDSKYTSWKKAVETEVKIGLSELYSSVEFSHLYNKIERYMTNILRKDNLFVVEKNLVWTDCDRNNIIVKDGRLIGFIDFESCFSGDPLMMLGYLFAKEGKSDLFEKVFSEFSQKDDLEIVYFYSLFRFLRIIKYQSFPLPNGQLRTPIFNYFKGLRICLTAI